MVMRGDFRARDLNTISQDLFCDGHAVIVGVGGDLPATANDAEAVAGLLTDPSRCGYPKKQVVLLKGRDAERGAMLRALEDLGTRVRQRPQSTVVVYFSGHGIRTPDFHLLLHGYDLDRLAETALSGALLTEVLGSLAARKLVLILDCCHAGGQAGIAIPKMPSAPVTRSILAELGRSAGRVLLASSRLDEVSLITGNHSEFTQALLEGMAGYGAFERDGFARVLDVAMYVGRAVANRTGDRQHPILKVSNLEDNFALAWYAGGSTQAKGLPGSSVPLPFPWLGAENLSGHWRRLLAYRREALLLIEERKSEFVEQQEIPMQLIRSQRHTEREIAALEAKLGMSWR